MDSTKKVSESMRAHIRQNIIVTAKKTSTAKHARKATALILSVVMLLGVAPVIDLSNDAGKAYAASGTQVSPSVTVYADKQQLMNFSTRSDGRGSVGRIILGKRDVLNNIKHNTSIFANPDYRAESVSLRNSVCEWYVLGRDSWIDGDNTVIFAELPIKYNVQFQLSEDDYPYSSYSYGTYNRFNMDLSKYVYASHYGRSNLRHLFQQLVGDAAQDSTTRGYFSDVEASILQPTTVRTIDDRNHDSTSDYSTYTTSDKLYAVAAESGGRGDVGTIIYAGTEDDIAIETNGTYSAKYGTWVYNHYWLRSPTGIRDINGCYRVHDVNYVWPEFALEDGERAVSGIWVTAKSEIGEIYLEFSRGARPASNLDLSKVLFASAAKAASSGTIANTLSTDTAMTLRIDAGDNVDLGKAIYSSDAIRIIKGTASDISLVVQGNEQGTKGNWYYSRKISGDEVINASSIKTAVGLSQVPDLTACKIWLETPINDGSTLTYAVSGIQHGHICNYLKWDYDEDTHYHKCYEDYCPNDGRIDVANHTWDSSKEIRVISYKEDGEDCVKTTSYYKVCTVCEAEMLTREETERLKHTYGEWTQLPLEHFKKCIYCVHISYVGEHVYDDDEDPICNDCEYDRSHGHVLKKVEAVEPTCTKEGNWEYWACTECGLRAKSRLGIVQLSDEDIIRPATGHSMVYHPTVLPTCTEEGHVGYHECTKCGLKFYDEEGNEEAVDIVLGAMGHELGEWQIDATKHWKLCTVCGVKLEEGAHYYVSGKCVDCGYMSSTRNTDKYNDGDSSGGSGSSSGSNGSSGAGGGTNGGGSYVNGGSGTTTNDGLTPATAIDGNSGGSGSGGIGGGSGNGNSSGSGWEHDGHGWKYKLPTGQYAAGTSETGPDGNTIAHALFVKIDGAIWAFGVDEYLIVGWVQDAEGKWWYIDIDRGLLLGWIYDASDDNWYYCSESKGMLTEWFYDTEASYWYYLDPETGAMHSDWQQISGNNYYLALKPPATTYSFNTSSYRWYYDNPQGYRPYGSMYADTTTPDNHQVDANGARVQ